MSLTLRARWLTLRVCPQENSAILKELVELRAQKSALLGFSTHADFILEMNMAQSAKKVAVFLGERLRRLRPPAPAGGAAASPPSLSVLQRSWPGS